MKEYFDKISKLVEDTLEMTGYAATGHYGVFKDPDEMLED